MARLTTGGAGASYSVLRYSLFALLLVVCLSFWMYSKPPSVALLTRQPISAHNAPANINASGFAAVQDTYAAAEEDDLSDDDDYIVFEEDLVKRVGNDAQLSIDPPNQQQHQQSQDCDASNQEACRVLLEAAHLTIAQLQRQNGELMNELNAAHIKHRRELVKLRQELNGVYISLDVAEEKLNDLQVQILRLTDVVSQHRVTIVQLEAQTQNLQAQAQQLNDDLLHAYENTYDDLREERERLLAKLADMQAFINDMFAQIETGQAEETALTEQVEGLGALVQHLVEQLQSTLQTLDNLSPDASLSDSTVQPPADAANRSGLSSKAIAPVPKNRRSVRGVRIEKSAAKGEAAKDAPLTLDGKLEIPSERLPQESTAKRMVWINE